MSIIHTKQEIRKQIKEKLKSLDDSTYMMHSKNIEKKVYSLHEWLSADTIGITLSGNREVETRTIIESAWSQEKRVAVPKCNPQTKTMTFREITDFSQLEIVYFGLQEPVEDQTIVVQPGEISLLFVPGLCFSKKGYRIGHGGGYYDRFLTKYQGNTLSLAFQMQIVDQLPIEPFDLPVKKLISEQQIIPCYE